MTSLRFDDEVAIVTGAGRGLGAAYARALAARGCRVVVNDLGCTTTGEPTAESPARDVVAAIRRAGGVAVVDDHDIVADPAAPVRRAFDEFGRIDIVVNNAGLSARNPFPQITADQLRAALDVHVVAAVTVTQAAWPHLCAAPAGRVLLTSSPGIFGVPGSLAYTAAKAAILGIQSTLGAEARSDGIRVNTILPGAHTRMIRGVPGTDIEGFMQRHFPPEYVAGFVCWLLHSATAVTGHAYVVGGGRAGRVVVAEGAGATTGSVEPESWLGREAELASTADPALPTSSIDELAHMSRHLGADVTSSYEAMLREHA